MDFGGPAFILLIIAISTIGWLANNWIRARHGYALEDEWGGKTDVGDPARTRALEQENAELKAELARFASRVEALETIVTDKGYDTATQIEALRDSKERTR